MGDHIIKKAVTGSAGVSAKSLAAMNYKVGPYRVRCLDSEGPIPKSEGVPKDHMLCYIAIRQKDTMQSKQNPSQKIMQSSLL